MTTSLPRPENNSPERPDAAELVEPPFTGSARPWLIAGLLPVGLLAVAMVVAYPVLPDPLPTHFNAAGEPDAWAPKSPWPLAGYFAVVAAVTGLLVGLGFANPRTVRVNGVRDPQGLDAQEADAYYAVKGRFLRLTCCLCLCWTNWLLCLLPALLIATRSPWALVTLVLLIPLLVGAFRTTGHLNEWIRRRFPMRASP
ncbi:DUF1648 domain-containing protein [Zhihengliuella flava]|uniref:Membrane protein n=1 Tax=Zhihengliuella flava TaxID=1285193 RepID=A0A931DBD4_9MICC|nr:DUF1648 domain-containing protein [Zhihengliuella flava]MBG6085347.1 putative membrane protein [Zhihengliuella flava]